MSTYRAIPAEQLSGNVALVSYRSPEMEGQGHWFRDWRLSGTKVAHHDDRAIHRQCGTLATGDSVDLPIELPPNTEIAIWGACGNECSNMDPPLRSTKGGILGRDAAAADFPLLIVETGGSLRYMLRVAIPACSQGPCYYVFGVYEKTGGGGEAEAPDALQGDVTPAREVTPTEEDGGG